MKTILYIMIVACATHGTSMFTKNGSPVKFNAKMFNEAINQNRAAVRTENKDHKVMLDRGQFFNNENKNYYDQMMKYKRAGSQSTEEVTNFESLLKSLIVKRNKISGNDRQNYVYLEDVNDNPNNRERELVKLGVIKVALLPADNRLKNSDNNILDSLQFRFEPLWAKKVRRRYKKTTGAGYTHDPDTCRTYNENLLKVWIALFKYINISDVPGKEALHNIALLIKAYLDHQHNRKDVNINQNIENVDSKNKYLNTIGDLLMKARNPVKSIYEFVLKTLKPIYDKTRDDCIKINEGDLYISIDLAYQNYLEYADCQNDGDSKALRLEDPNNKHNSEYIFISNLRSEKSTAKENNLISKDEILSNIAEASVTRPVDDINNSNDNFVTRENKNTNSIDSEILKNTYDFLYGDYIEKTPDTLQSLPFPKYELNLRRSTNSCSKLAIRKFLNIMKSILKRYMDQSKCKTDATLRSQNNSSFTPVFLHKTQPRSNSSNMFSLVEQFNRPESQNFLGKVTYE